MTLGSHITPLARSYISNADVVFTGLSDGIIELWLAKMAFYRTKTGGTSGDGGADAPRM